MSCCKGIGLMINSVVNERCLRVVRTWGNLKMDGWRSLAVIIAPDRWSAVAELAVLSFRQLVAPRLSLTALSKSPPMWRVQQFASIVSETQQDISWNSHIFHARGICIFIPSCDRQRDGQVHILLQRYSFVVKTHGQVAFSCLAVCKPL